MRLYDRWEVFQTIDGELRRGVRVSSRIMVLGGRANWIPVAGLIEQTAHRISEVRVCFA